MYKNVGKSIKTLVNVLVIIGIAICALVAFLGLAGLVLATGFSDEAPVAMIISAVGIIISCGVMAFFIWLSGLTLYAYGEIAENTAKMVQSQNVQIGQLREVITYLREKPVEKVEAPAVTEEPAAAEAPIETAE